MFCSWSLNIFSEDAVLAQGVRIAIETQILPATKLEWRLTTDAQLELSMLFLVVLYFGEANLQLGTIYRGRRLVECIAWLLHCRERLTRDCVCILSEGLTELLIIRC